MRLWHCYYSRDVFKLLDRGIGMKGRESANAEVSPCAMKHLVNVPRLHFKSIGSAHRAVSTSRQTYGSDVRSGLDSLRNISSSGGAVGSTVVVMLVNTVLLSSRSL